MKTTLITFFSLVPALTFAEEIPLIVTDIPPVYTMVRDIIGDDAHVELLLTPKQDMHHFSLKPSQAKLLQEADLFIAIGANLTPHLVDDYTALNPEGKSFYLSDVFQKNEFSDPHYWIESNLWTMLKVLTDTLIWGFYPEISKPENTDDIILRLSEISFESYYSNYSDIQFNQNIILSHNAFQYFINAASINLIGSLTDAHDNPLSAKERQEIIAAIQRGEVSCLIVDSSEGSKEYDTFAKEHELNMVSFDVMGWKYLEERDFFTNYYGDLVRAFSECR